MNVEVVTERAAFAELADDWRDLLESCPRPSPFQAHPWIGAGWASVGGRTVVVAARREGRLVAALPLTVRGAGARFVTEPSDMDALLRCDEPLDTLRAVLAAAQHHAGYIACFAARDGVLRQALEPASPFFQVGTAKLLTMPEGWDAAYASRFGGKSRSEHRRRLRRLEGEGPVEFELARSGGELRRALDDVLRLHRLRWAGRHDQSNLAREEGRRFHERLVGGLEERDGHTIVLLRVAGTAVAFHWYARIGETMTGYRIGFDPAYGRYSVGLLTTLRALETAAAEGATVANFLRGDEEYKQQICNEESPLLAGAFLAQRPLARAHALAYQARQRAWLALHHNTQLKRGYHRLVALRNEVRRR